MNENAEPTSSPRTASPAPFAGLVAAIASSLCCMGPALAALAGSASLAGSFHWLGPLRPWLMGLSALALGYAWWAWWRNRKAEHCASCAPGPKPFTQRTGFLVAVTALAIGASAYPLLATGGGSEAVQAPATAQRIVIPVHGMTCTGCEGHVSEALRAVPGVADASASYERGEAIVSVDTTIAPLALLYAAIDSTGYTAIRPRP
jgi:copper chaperone CopZ